MVVSRFVYGAICTCIANARNVNTFCRLEPAGFALHSKFLVSSLLSPLPNAPMAFFGFEQNDLEQEKSRFKTYHAPTADDVAEYTWGEEGYDGLGDLLQEGRDELNDETFGDTLPIGTHFSAV